MSRVAGRLQAVGAGMLLLAVTVGAPALSAAQDGADPGAESVEPPLTTPAPEPGDAGSGDAGSGDGLSGPDANQQATGEATTETTAPEPKAAPQKRAKAAAGKTVSVGDNFYDPETISIQVGTTVTWKNNGAAPHSATADDGSFDTGVFNGGQSRSERFTEAGNVPYFCTVHGQAQQGTVRVLSSGGGDGGGGGSGTSGSSGPSEAAAVASPGAAGSSTSLPATGFAAIGLAAVGIALLGSGTALRRLDGRALWRGFRSG